MNHFLSSGQMESIGLLAQFDGPPKIFMSIFALVFIFIAGVIVFSIVKSVSQWSKNNQQPVLTVPAKVVTKRAYTSTSHHHDHDRMQHHNTSSTTRHHATFQVQSGDRVEFVIAASEYGLLAEGDEGQLTFQGTRYKGFQRNKSASGPAAAPESTRGPALTDKEIYCPYCGLGVASEFKFCPKCGKTLPEFVVES